MSWTICKSSAPRYRQITMPAPDHSFLQARCSSCHPTNSVKAMKLIDAQQSRSQKPSEYHHGGLCNTAASFARQTYNARESRTWSKADRPRNAHPAQLHLWNHVYLYMHIVKKHRDFVNGAKMVSFDLKNNTQLKCVLTLTYNITYDMLTFKCAPDIIIIKLRQWQAEVKANKIFPYIQITFLKIYS